MNSHAPDPNVYFSGAAHGDHGRERPGRPIFIEKSCPWDDAVWHFPAAYACTAGLVLDLCVETPPERIRAFMEKWDLSPESDGSGFTRDQIEQITRENPLSHEFTACAHVNGKTLRPIGMTGCTWIPDLPDEDRRRTGAAETIDRYGLDPSRGWSLHRIRFPWATRRRPAIRTLQLTLSPRPAALPCLRFRMPCNDRRIAFTHPLTGAPYVLTLHELIPDVIPTGRMFRSDGEWPAHFNRLIYSISPDPPAGALQLQDCAESDAPRFTGSDCAAAIGVIGGADGPTSMLRSAAEADGRKRVACSSLHFSPVESVEWRAVFYERLGEDFTANLI